MRVSRTESEAALLTLIRAQIRVPTTAEMAGVTATGIAEMTSDITAGIGAGISRRTVATETAGIRAPTAGTPLDTTRAVAVGIALEGITKVMQPVRSRWEHYWRV